MNIDVLQRSLAGGEAYLITSPQNRLYFTGFEATDAFLAVTAKESIFLTDSRYIEAATGEVDGCTDVRQYVRFDKELPVLMKQLGVSTVFLEASRVTVHKLHSFERIFEGFTVDASDRLDNEINALRICKSQAEKELVLTAQRIAEKGFEHMLGYLREGVSEREAALELDYYMLREGSRGVSFETIVVSGKNGSKPHGVPGERLLRRGDLVTLDFGAVCKGYRSDMTRTVAIGEISDRARLVYETVLRAQQAALNTVGPGVSGFDADAAARNVIKEAGFGDFFGHSTGHGVGVEIHEQPALSPIGRDILREGNIVTVEPGIYLPGECGVRIEDMVYITANGYENLTSSPKKLIIL